MTGSTGSLRGLTWDHPRGYRVLEELSRRDGAVPGVRWSRQSLADFESRPVRSFARETDLVVLDHPGLGEALADGCLRPLDELFPAAELAGWRAACVGPSFDSYALAGRQWALPIDAATQVGVVSAEPAAGPAFAPPGTWDEAIALAAAVPTTLCLGGPHALLMFATLCVAFGHEPAGAGRQDDAFVDTATGRRALAVLRELLAHADRDSSLRNPIAVLDAMSAAEGPVYCPLVYGYVTYQTDRPDRPGRRRLSAMDAPAGTPGGRRGSVLGGTGIAVTTACRDDDAVRRELRRLLSDPVQGALYAEFGGQSATIAGWRDEGADRRYHGFYGNTRSTLDQAWTRPRFAGYVPFQRDGSAVLRAGLLEREPDTRVLARLDDLYRRAAGEGAAARQEASRT